MSKKLSVTTGSIAMITSMLGCGVLFLPSCFLQLGEVKGPIVLLAATVICFYTLYAISYSAYVFRKKQLKGSIETENIQIVQKNHKENEEYDQKNRINANINERRDVNISNHCLKTLSQNEQTNIHTLDQQKYTIPNTPPLQQHYASSDQEKTTPVDHAIPSDEKIDAGLSYYSVAANHSIYLAIAVDVCILLQGIGSCVCYLQTMATWAGSLLGISGRRMLISAVMGVPLYVLSVQRNLSALKYASLLSVTAVLYLAGLLLSYAVLLPGIPLEPREVLKGAKIYRALSGILFALGSHQNIVQVFSEMKRKKMHDILAVSLVAYTVGPLLYFLIAFAGVYVANKEASQNILTALISPNTKISAHIQSQSFDSKGYLPYAGAILFFFVLICSFPMQMHPTRNSVTNLLCFNSNLKNYAKNNLNFVKFIITNILCLMVFLIAIIPNLEPDAVVSFIGATATVSVVFIFPAIIYCMTIGKINFKSIIAAIVGVFGVFLSFYLIYSQMTDNK